MLKLGIVVIGIVFLIGCTTKKEDALMNSYKEHVNYHKQLQKTEKVQLFDNDNLTKIVLTATYLYTPNFLKYDQRDEQFIVGVHLEDETVIDIKDMIEIFGIRDTDDIRQMRDQQNKESKVVPNSLYDDMIGLLNPKNDNLKTTNKKKTNKTKLTTNNNVKKYGLILQGKHAIQIKALSKDDERLKDMAYITDWGTYYLVTFEHTKSKRFSLLFKSDEYGNGTFSFAKVAKYTYTKKGF